MNYVIVGEVQSHAGAGLVLAIGRPETVERATLAFRRGDEDELAFVVTPRFDVAWLPEAVIALGEVHDSVHDGPFLEIPVDRKAALVATLEGAGFEVVLDDGRMRSAEGY